MAPAKVSLDDAFIRSAWPIVFAAAARASFGDLHTAEDATAAAFERATRTWNAEPPDNPNGWLVTVAKRFVIDDARRRASARRNAHRLAHEAGPGHAPITRNDVLDLYFMCAHPALSEAAQVALTLRSVGGLRPAEIARAFHLTPSTIEKRLVRARAKIRDAAIPFRAPDDDDLEDRLAVVLRVIMLIFNEGYAPTHGDGAFRQDLCDEAIYLAGTLRAELSEHPEPRSLLALLLLLDSRRHTRFVDGCLVPLRLQDRARWDTRQICAGVELTLDALSSEQRSTYTLRAAIAALHAEAPSHATTPWRQVAELYDTLVELEPSVSNEIGHAVAHLETSGAATARPLLQAVTPPDGGSRFVLNLAWARLHELDHERTMAVQSLDQALLDSPTEADRNAIERLRAAQIAHTHGADGRSNGRQRRSSAERDPT